MKEKRKFPRANKVLPVKLSGEEFDILTETKNISASGAYFSVNKALQPMTKFKTVLLIPIKKNKDKVIKKINCCAVVVRCELTKDKSEYPYRVGVYFADLKEKDRKILCSCINSFLSS